MTISWRFRLPESMASIKQVSLCENISIWYEQQKSWFYGYKTLKNLNAVIWGKKVSLSLNIAPFSAAIEKMPIAPLPAPQPKRSKLTVERQTQLDAFQARLTALKATIPPKLADENVYWNYVDPEIFVSAFQQMVLAWNNPEMALKEKFPLVSPFLVRLYHAVKAMTLPDELMRDDTRFYIGLARILQYTQIIEENARIHHVTLPPEVHELSVLLDKLTDRMVEGGHKIFGLPPEVDEDEEDAFLKELVDVLHISTLSIPERLDTIERLLNASCADPDSLVELLEGAIKLIWQEVARQPGKPPCPHKALIERHLEEIGKYLKALEEEGEKLWQLRMAEEMIDGANNWRESDDMPLLTQEEFAALIFLTDLNIKTIQMEDATISCNMELFFNDKEDSFAGHTMYAKVENKTIKEFLLMG